MPAVKSQWGGGVAETIVQSDGLTFTVIVGTTSQLNIDYSIAYFLFRSQTVADTTERVLLTCPLSVDGSNVLITFTRGNANAAASDIEVDWFVTEFESSACPEIVQRGEVVRMAASTAIGIVPVDTEAALILTSLHTTLRRTPFDTDIGYTVEFTDLTGTDSAELTIASSGAPTTGESVVEYQVVAFNTGDIFTQHYITAVNDAATQTLDTTIGTLANAFVILTGNYRLNAGNTRGATLVKLNSVTQVGLNNQTFGTGSAAQTSYTVCEFLDSGVVKKDEVTILDGDTTPTTQPTFTALDEDQANPFVGISGINNSYCIEPLSDHVINNLFTTVAFNAGGAGVTLTRYGSSGDFVHQWLVLEWASASAGAINAAITEVLIASDVQSNILISNSIIAEVLNTIDDQQSNVAASVILNEVLTALESQSSTLTGESTITEVLTALDSQSSIAGQVGAITEVLTALESQSNTLTSASTINEVLTALESSNATLGQVSTIAELLTAFESQSNILTSASTISEVLTALESQSNTLTSASTITEVLNALDSQSSIAGQVGSIVEVLAALESTGATVGQVSIITEVLTALESATVSFVASVNIAEVLTANDTPSAIFTSSSSLSEVLSALDSQSEFSGVLGVISETGVLSDIVNATTLEVSAITEVLTALDSQGAIAGLSGAMSESTLLVDGSSATALRNAGILEALTITDLQNASVGDIIVILHPVKFTMKLFTGPFRIQ